MSEERKASRPKGPRPGGHGGHGGPPLGRPVEKAKNFKASFIRLAKYLKPQRANLVAVFIFALFSTAFTVLGPKITGNAMNQVTDGFVAKSIVSGISKAQPDLKKAVKAYDDAIAAATKKADDMVTQKFSQTIAAQKQAAYQQAAAAADAAVTQKFNETVAAQKQAAYQKAAAQADAVATQKFSEAVAAQKQTALAQAKQQAEAIAKAAVDAQFAQSAPGVPAADYPSLPGYSDALKAAYAQADTQAQSMVDASFAQQQAALDAKLADAKAQAEAAAKAAVDKGFAAQQATLDAKLADARAQAEAAAKGAVDKGFSDQQATLDTKLADAKTQAEKAAKDAVTNAFLKKMKVTKAQFDTFRQLGSLPVLTDVKDYGRRADIAQTFFDDMKKLPSSMVSGNSSIKSSDVKISNISDANLKKYVDVIRQNGGNIPFDAIVHTLIFLLAVYALSSLLTFAMQFIMSTVAQGVVFEMRRDVDSKLARLPLRYFDSHANGEILSRMTNDIDTISTTLQQSLTQLITSVLQLIGYVIMMLTISPILTLIVLGTLPLYIVVTMFIAKNSQKFYTAQQKYLGELSGHTEEMFTGHRIVKAFGHEKDSVGTFEAYNDELYNAGWKAQFLSGVMFPVMNFISNVGYVLISVVGGIFVTKTWLNIGDITAFITYSRSFSQPIVQTANIANIIQSTVACAERVFEVLDEEEEISDPADAVALPAPRGDIDFDHVKFSYKEDEPLIEDMNLSIKKGDTVAIVGPTGAGKTTLVNLLMRFYEIGGGSIAFDGVDLRKIRRGSLRTMYGMVLQDTWLFTGTIGENIRYGRMNATDEEVVRAAKAAHADHFIRSLPDGYQTVLNEEASNISQGQKQLLTIARAILADPTVLILDEATSSVDTRTEVLIQKAMGVLMQGRTNFVIAHRLSTIRDAKLILVMNHGTIIEKGSHEELMARKGFYADLYNSQFTGPSVEDQAV
jgi:ATP-binding cassette subfamily B protein